MSASVHVETIRIYVSGHLKKNPADTSASLSKATIFVKGNNKVLAGATSDRKGNFNIDFLDQHEPSFDFYYTNAEKDTLLLLSTRTFKSDEPEITFPVPATVKKNKAGQVICLKCKKADKVFKIIYADGVPGNPDDQLSSGNREIYAGRIIRLARYYCSRDKVNF